MTTSTSKGTINPLSEMRQRSMDPATRWDHLQPAQMAKLFLEADVCDLDEAWAKLIKCEAQDRTSNIPEWKPSMLMNVARREYHTYFPMLMEMNSTEFRCVSCRCVPTEVDGQKCPTHGLPQLAYQMEDWYATPALNYLPPQVTNIISGGGGLWLCEGGTQPRASIEHTCAIPHTDNWEDVFYERDQSIMCVTNPLTKEHCYLPPFIYKLDRKSAMLKIVDWDVETDEIMKCLEWSSNSISRPGSGECSPRITKSEPTSPKRSKKSPKLSPLSPCSPCSEPEVNLHLHEIEIDEPPKQKKKKVAYSNKVKPYWEDPPFKKCTGGRVYSTPNCSGAPKFNPRWTWNPRDKFHSLPCTRCHSDYCATRFNHPQEFTGNFPKADEWNCATGCTTDHGSSVPVHKTPAPTHREFQKLLDLPTEKHKEPWIVKGNAMPICIPPGYIVPGSPKYIGPRSNQNFKDNEPVILMDLNGREIGLGQVWKRKTGDVMDWNPLKYYETAVVVTRCDIDVDLEWERARYFGQKLRKKKIIGSKEVGKGNMMCSLPIRWPSSLLIRPSEVSMAMKCQMNIDHLEGRDDPSFGSPAISNIIREMWDPVKHPTRQITSPTNDMCYKKCQYGTSKRFIVVVMGYHYLKEPNKKLEEDLVVAVYESFMKKWTFKRLTAGQCRLMPESQGKTGVAILGDDPRELAVIFGGLAINVKEGREEEEELFESTLFYCPLYSRRRLQKQYLFHGRKIDPTNCHQLYNFEMRPPIVLQPFRQLGQCSVQAVTRKIVQFSEIAETIYIVNINLNEEMIPTGYFDLLSRMPENNFHELFASATAFTPQYIEHASGEGLIIFKAGHNPTLVIYDVFWNRWIATKYPQQQEGERMKHWQLCDGVWKPDWRQRSGNNDLLLAMQP